MMLKKKFCQQSALADTSAEKNNISVNGITNNNDNQINLGLL